MNFFLIISSLIFIQPVQISYNYKLPGIICDNAKSFNLFKKAAEVAIVSYSETQAPEPGIGYWKNKAKEEAGKIIMPKFYEYKKLDKEAIDLLGNIIYGKSCKKKALGSECYFPRHAIIFKDNSGNIFSCIEVCFECEQMAMLPNDVQSFVICESKLTAIKDFFKKYGLTNGFGKIY
ncbi:MAG: hypothetical protein IPJ81_17220 [Chitinophagaceae bacterium]|nr:hypothetical protein [Chitinophagaceae bacterium]